MLYIALEVPLCAFSLARFFEGDHARTPRVEMLHEALDRAPFPRGVASFEQKHNLLPVFFCPTLGL